MNNKISIAQTQALIIMASLGFEILILPMIIGSITQLIITLLAGFLLCVIGVYSKVDISESKVLCFIYSVKNIIVTILLTKILADAIKNVMLNDVLIYKIILIIVLVSGYGAWKGVEAAARISQMLFWFIVIGTVYVYAMVVPDIDLSNIVYKTGVKNAGTAVLLGLIVNIAEIIILLKPNMKVINGEILKGAAFGLLLVFAVAFVIMGRLGAKGIEEVEYPFFEIMYTADLPNVFVKRQEGIFISLWIISAFISIFIYFSTTIGYMTDMKINKKSALIVLMILIFIFASVYKGNMRAIRTYCFLQIIGGMITVFIIPLIYMFRRNKIE